MLFATCAISIVTHWICHTDGLVAVAVLISVTLYDIDYENKLTQTIKYRFIKYLGNS